MEQECVVFGCRNSSIVCQSKKNDCNFFNFPLEQPDLVDKWLKKLHLDGWTPGPENVVCEEHFSLDSFEIVNDKRILKPEALPSMIDDWRRIITDDEILDSYDEEADPDLRCRICAKFLSNKDAVDIYSKDDNVMEKIMACIPILVKAADSLPKHICRLCLTDLNISYRMLVRAIESEKIFNNLITKSHDKPAQNNEETVEKINEGEKNVTMCVICNIQFNDVNELSAHFQEKHVDEFDFNEQPAEKLVEMECDKFQENLLTFVDIKDVGENLKNEAIIELEYEQDLQDENKTATEKYCRTEKQPVKQKSWCSICSMSFASKDILDFHTENFHKSEKVGVQATDDECINLDDDDDIEVMENGTDDDTDVQYMVCQFCMQVFYTVNELNTHLETHIESLACDVCGFLCHDKEKLKKHRETHVKRNNKNNTCSICCTVFLTHSDMIQHSKEVHRLKEIKDVDASPQKWICKYCGKEIGTKLSLSIHERIHTGVRPYVCECCGRSFKSKANLIQHQPVHTGIKRYKCSVCDKAFARKAFVTTHMRVHTGERPFKCEICGNRYTQIGDMRRHKKRHMIAQTANINRAVSTTESTSRSVEIVDVVDDDKPISIEQGAMFENNGIIKLHFAKDVTDFRRILVELQQ